MYPLIHNRLTKINSAGISENPTIASTADAGCSTPPAVESGPDRQHQGIDRRAQRQAGSAAVQTGEDADRFVRSRRWRERAKRSLTRPVIGFKITSQALGRKTIMPATRAEMPNESVR